MLVASTPHHAAFSSAARAKKQATRRARCHQTTASLWRELVGTQPCVAVQWHPFAAQRPPLALRAGPQPPWCSTAPPSHRLCGSTRHGTARRCTRGRHGEYQDRKTLNQTHGTRMHAHDDTHPQESRTCQGIVSITPQLAQHFQRHGLWALSFRTWLQRKLQKLAVAEMVCVTVGGYVANKAHPVSASPQQATPSASAKCAWRLSPTYNRRLAPCNTGGWPTRLVGALAPPSTLRYSQGFLLPGGTRVAATHTCYALPSTR